MKAFLFQYVPFKPALKTTHCSFYVVHKHHRIINVHYCSLSAFSVAICISGKLQEAFHLYWVFISSFLLDLQLRAWFPLTFKPIFFQRDYYFVN